ncbi:Hypothetical predicted protein [Olea europaea subsp. europaea]|uniref:Uncharacterized protein n=1 Tax=Olea europaea subsp. europaea TaxID=158383 RepID=A0A8S0PPP1_OLEEU|nr:Hypothetical predicted protein [Olea europaea subsp. europaea]
MESQITTFRMPKPPDPTTISLASFPSTISNQPPTTNQREATENSVKKTNVVHPFSAGISTSSNTQGRTPPLIDCPPQTNLNHGPNLPKTTIQQSKLNPKTNLSQRPFNKIRMLQIATPSDRP